MRLPGGIITSCLLLHVDVSITDYQCIQTVKENIEQILPKNDQLFTENFEYNKS